jgi:hypothetical protein
MQLIPLHTVKNLNIEDVFMLINETTDLYSTIKKHNGYFTLYGSYMFEFPVHGQYSFAEIQKLWNNRIIKQQSKEQHANQEICT